jgi:hypothetical protein
MSNVKCETSFHFYLLPAGSYPVYTSRIILNYINYHISYKTKSYKAFKYS